MTDCGTPRAERVAKLRQAIIQHTDHTDMFWLGEHLLDALDTDPGEKRSVGEEQSR